MRGRNRNGGGGGGGNNGGGGGGGGRGPNPLTRSYESNGPDVKIRGTASTIADKYVQLSRDALTSGDPVAAENYMQHAEHYYRLLAAAQAQYQPNQMVVRADADDFNDGEYDEENGETQSSAEQQSFQVAQNAQPAPQNNGQQQPRFDRDRNRPNGNAPNGNVQGGNVQSGAVQGGQTAPQNGQNNGERRFDRNERRDRPERDRSADRPERADRAERQPQADRGSDDQPFVGDLPSFITGEAPVRVESPKPVVAKQPVVAPEPVVTTAPEAPSVAPEAGDEDGEGRVAPRGRRRRFGRAGRAGAEGEADAAPAPETAGD